MNDVLKTASNIGIIPVIAIENADDAVPLARALTAGGLPAAEITFRTAAGEESIRRVAKECPEVLVGAGTVLNMDQCRRALDAGARFIVSPGYNPELVDFCVKENVVVLPGCVNASDMTRAFNAGLEVVKFFPAEQSGGVGFLKALAPVIPLKFMPTGGVNTKNLMDYLSFNRIAACGGTWMVKKDLIEGHRWEEITAICKDAVKTMLGFSLAHVGVNCESEAEAEKAAKTMCALFGLEYKPGNSSIFAGGAVEYMKTPYLGRNGHIAIATNSLDRAVYHLGRQGVEFDESTRKPKAIYLKDEVAGFAIHLVQK
ncbi:MAG: bifunctional 4-hydroxy-2-oxoglutarate aldolase/2-dehydro-3-deoxy-phosphogluconate aldolase [Oscillibacter sp.]|nr:bifunctional 4-hydroxy-2-oxoglutarate aldolase/2-dehydro-3-deoxy-phosphogluconate aldolase [Oscillibacter sp.]MBD5148451.1 bifunctional 4-hydroxy-2-oxoglutarate aldolase/2-dehydro-3-deoxy-phosphogluconate aldolase [Oscillibacter sp.]